MRFCYSPSTALPGRLRGVALMAGAAALWLCQPVMAHHSVLNFDGKREVSISGVVSSSRYGFPHSVFLLEVVDSDGRVQEWTLTTEDPRDAKRLGFDDALKNLKPGDQITAVGWPHRFNEREIRGHQLHYPDGRVVMMRRGNYIWPKDILRLDKLVANPGPLDTLLQPVDATLPLADQLTAWASENDPVARAAHEVVQGRPRLIGIADGHDQPAAFPGVTELLLCHTQRPAFVMVANLADLAPRQRQSVTAALNYITEFNRLLSRWWEQERSSCQ